MMEGKTRLNGGNLVDRRDDPFLYFYLQHRENNAMVVNCHLTHIEYMIRDSSR